MRLRLDALLCDRRPRTYSKVTLGNLLAWFITALTKLQAKLPFISSLPSHSERFQKVFSPEKFGEVLVRFTPHLAGGQGWKLEYTAPEIWYLV